MGKGLKVSDISVLVPPTLEQSSVSSLLTPLLSTEPPTPLFGLPK